ncbi:MAG: Proline iminopeptidase [candidate division WS6 bacterium OLB20]|uniref:Proline iminopeptidase n=1 Tax=candidate division WS6 bacterium OLB20 TaxID=1617426 RepID=A0A136LYG9_9BACT|nr:MAG: Proline iminopeptidase [candidate division WS6 bacterium OLB20]
MEPHFITSGTHKIAYYVHGNSKGPAVVMLHGGPGSRSKSKYVKHFDLDSVQVIQIDQRGCGESTAENILSDNTTQHLIADIEAVREKIGRESWYLYGGSWGATLALVYAQKHPERVLGLILRSIFMARRQDTLWAFGDSGAAMMAPELYETQRDFEKEHSLDTFAALKLLYRQVTEGSEEEQRAAAAQIFGIEDNLMAVGDAHEDVEPGSLDEDTVKSAQIYLHYMVNDFFIADTGIYDGMKAISDIPTLIVHGRHDILCPYVYSWQISRMMHNCQLIAAESSGHKLSSEASELVQLGFQKMLCEAEMR